MKKSSSTLLAAVVLGMNLIFCACVQKMGIEGHLRPMGDEPSQSITTRQPPDGTVSRDIQISNVTPMPITQRLLQQGREQFNIYCMACHGMSGHGDGMIVQRGFLAPPSYHIDRLRQVNDQHFFDVITRGYGAMYSYADRVSPSDRWAIAAYIRALQLSQNSKLVDLPVTDQNKLKELKLPPESHP